MTPAVSCFAARSQVDSAQLTSLHDWHIKPNHAPASHLHRHSPATQALATASDLTTIASGPAIDRRQLLAGFTAMTAGANQVGRLQFLAVLNAACKDHWP